MRREMWLVHGTQHTCTWYTSLQGSIIGNGSLFLYAKCPRSTIKQLTFLNIIETYHRPSKTLRSWNPTKMKFFIYLFIYLFFQRFVWNTSAWRVLFYIVCCSVHPADVGVKGPPISIEHLLGWRKIVDSRYMETLHLYVYEYIWGHTFW